MKIIYNPIFENELFHIVNHIAQDKPNGSIRFALELEKSILDIPIFPFKHNPSSYFDDKNVRDMTYKSYTVVNLQMQHATHSILLYNTQIYKIDMIGTLL
jgi:hypothetical protein